MALVLIPAFCLLSGAYAQEWGVTLAPGPLAGGTGSCVTIPCSFTYPEGSIIWAVSWIRDGDQIVYHWNDAHVHAAYKGRTHYLGDLQHNCSLRVSGLRPNDQGIYHFQFEVIGPVRNEGWISLLGQRLNVYGNQLLSSNPGSLTLATHECAHTEQGSSHTHKPFLPCSEIQVGAKKTGFSPQL
ncbi:sialoadhesin-like [Dermochelys coriacea]|uniref:sialoadhesin-like n=1 Tax=Dermochelys coriacea TaxID=27794 RepID=UPI001CA854FC|nr:sialoadhesin-like [Dermochelys coriacea]XP_043357892.1 sialoadhesin-like [Dermochelys coriacea]XP_043357893.1 sialoadhesin-like [Dermochelys coriacea]